MKFLVKINIKRKGGTTADLIEIKNNSIVSKKIVPLNISHAPDKEFLLFKISKFLGHENFEIELI